MSLQQAGPIRYSQSVQMISFTVQASSDSSVGKVTSYGMQYRHSIRGRDAPVGRLYGGIHGSYGSIPVCTLVSGHSIGTVLRREL
jgi:hypothetical protein